MTLVYDQVSRARRDQLLKARQTQQQAQSRQQRANKHSLLATSLFQEALLPMPPPSV